MGCNVPKHPYQLFDERYKVDDDGCWIWNGMIPKHGYGVFSSKYAGRNWTELAHRASWILHNGQIPDGLFVCHHCDVTACVNPEHLFLGTQEDNMKDASRKKRFNDRRGEKNARAKLTESDVKEIIRLYNSGLKYKEIAEEFSITKESVSNVVRGITWRHIA